MRTAEPVGQRENSLNSTWKGTGERIPVHRTSYHLLERQCHHGLTIVEKVSLSENLREMAAICGFDEGDACRSAAAQRDLLFLGVQGYPVAPPTWAKDESIKNKASHRPQSWRTRTVDCLPSVVA
jgi:hypothetical protein